MKYSGAWRTRAAGRTDDTAPLGSADPSRHMSDYDTDLHGVDDTADTRRAMATPYRLDYAPGELIDRTDTFTYGTDKQYVSDVPLDGEPLNHGEMGEPYSGRPRGDSVTISPRHDVDLGSIAAREYETPFHRQHDQREGTPRVQANVTIDGSNTALLRGANAYSINNPLDTVQRTAGDPRGSAAPRVGWSGEPRVGFRINRTFNRVMAMHRPRYDSRPLRNRVAKTAGSGPGFDGSEANAYTSPYADMARMRRMVYNRPTVRREPRDWDETALHDGTEQTTETANYQVWGL